MPSGWCPPASPTLIDRGLGPERARQGTFRAFDTERARLGTLRGFGIENAIRGTFRGFGTERAKLGTFKKILNVFYSNSKN